MAKEKDNLFISEFIDLYKSFPSLWKIKSKEYSDRNQKMKAYEILVEKLKEVDENATRDSVIKKINALRTAYRKEMKKVNQSEKSGAAEEDIYIPHLWYYDQLCFLKDQDIARGTMSNVMENNVDSDEEIGSSQLHLGLNTSRRKHISQASSSESQTLISRTASGSNCAVDKKRKFDTKQDEVLTLIADKLKKSSAGKFAYFGMHVTEELNNLPDEMATYCQKIINDAIFEAKLNNLNRTSYIQTAQETLLTSSLPVAVELNEEFDV